jgi:hypothetical protein
MDTLESRGVIRRIIEEDGTLLVSFSNHDGYFRVPDSARMPELKERMLTAQRDNEEIFFTFDKNLNILQVSGAPEWGRRVRLSGRNGGQS